MTVTYSQFNRRNHNITHSHSFPFPNIRTFPHKMPFLPTVKTPSSSSTATAAASPIPTITINTTTTTLSMVTIPRQVTYSSTIITLRTSSSPTEPSAAASSSSPPSSAAEAPWTARSNGGGDVDGHGAAVVAVIEEKLNGLTLG